MINIQMILYIKCIFFYFRAIAIEYTQLVPDNYPSFMPKYLRKQFIGKNVNIIGDNVRLSESIIVDRKLYYGSVDENGDVIDVFSVAEGVAAYASLLQIKECEYVTLPENVVIGFVGDLSDRSTFTYLHSIILSLENANNVYIL